MNTKVSSLYPSIIISNNIGQNPLVGKVIMKDKFYELNQDPDNEHYDAAKELFEDLATKNYSVTGRKWFNLPETTELIKELESKIK